MFFVPILAFCLRLRITCASFLLMAKEIDHDLLRSPDARRVSDAVEKIGRGAIERIEESLPGAIAGGQGEVRAYVSAYRDLTQQILGVLPQSPAPRTAPWSSAVLEREAMSAPFTDWVGTLGAGKGTATAIIATLRKMIPNASPLASPPGRRQPKWEMDEAAVSRFYRAVLDELESASAPFERIRGVLGINRTELAHLFGVRRQALDHWSANGVPADRQEKLATLGEIADLLVAKLKADRIPGVVRRPAVAYGGRSALEAIADGEAELVLAELRDAFDWASAA
jgi:hypothetical protein